METFIQWFKRRGWKTYTLPFIIQLAITIGVLFLDGGIGFMIKYNDVPLLVWILVLLVWLGFTGGMIWHMITAYRKQRIEK